jgi:hypothetical protein
VKSDCTVARLGKYVQSPPQHMHPQTNPIATSELLYHPETLYSGLISS